MSEGGVYPPPLQDDIVYLWMGRLFTQNLQGVIYEPTICISVIHILIRNLSNRKSTFYYIKRYKYIFLKFI